MADTGTLTQDAEGAVQWELKGFTSLRMNTRYDSPDFSFAGGEWYLRIRRVRPEGGRSGQRIELSVSRYFDAGLRTLDVEYTFSVRRWDGHRHGEERNRKEFGWGTFSPRIGIELEEDRMSDLVPDDTLTVLCRLERIHPTRGAVQLTEELRQKTGELASVKRELAEKQSELVRLRRLVEELNLKVTDLEADRDNAQKSLQTETEASASGSRHHKPRILRDLKQMFLNREDSDVVIRVKEREFKAHSFILKARSPVLASALRSDMRERATGIVDIDDLDPSAFSDFLRFLYCEEVDSLSAESVFHLYAAADKYDVPELRSTCVEFMRQNLCVDTFCEVMRLALLHSETELISLCTDFFIRNAAKIVKSVEWQKFIAENPTQGNELVIKFVTSVEHSNK